MFGWQWKMERIWWGLRVFSLGPPKHNIPKLERKLLKNICTKMPKLGFFKLHYVRCYLWFCFIYFFLGFLFFFFILFTEHDWFFFFFFFYINWAWLNQIDWVLAFLFFFFLIGIIFFNKDIWVNLYKLHFPSSHFSHQPNERVFHLSTLPFSH